MCCYTLLIFWSIVKDIFLVIALGILTNTKDKNSLYRIFILTKYFPNFVEFKPSDLPTG